MSVPNYNQAPNMVPHNEYIEAEHSSYEEVDDIVSNEDDQKMLCSTFRACLTSIWYQTYLQSPYAVPGWVQANIAVGFICINWIISPLLWYTDVWNFKILPIQGSVRRSVDGSIYRIAEVVDIPASLSNLPQYRLNETAYEKYGPVRLPLTMIVSYACHLAFIPAIIVHTILYHGKDILKHLHTSLNNRNNDIHCRLMSNYKEAPEWWYAVLFILVTVLSTIICHLAEIMPWYYVLIAASVAFLLILPAGILYANTGLAEFLFTMPASNLLASLFFVNAPTEAVVFNMYIPRSTFTAINFLVVLKLSHFMKIPPRVMFVAIIICSLISAITCSLTAFSIRKTIKTPTLCDRSKPEQLCVDEAAREFALAILFSLVGKCNQDKSVFCRIIR
ncbi:unnamed protein product [Didymodactylos carnosus]|uniref:Uncharacterized protein n=1 Tax=Didymodactylos carnosus TaxID=1234261 RepID=A0A814B9F9_9BILA|nr:unnamed protein product [Didymodactylos carnosus]CAF3704806.1 unnamed protein product [Didymodactylos carnosus]